MKLKTTKILFINGLDFDTDDFELEFEEVASLLQETTLTVKSDSLSNLIKYLFSKGFKNVPVDIPSIIWSEDYILRLLNNRGGYTIDFR